MRGHDSAAALSNKTNENSTLRRNTSSGFEKQYNSTQFIFDTVFLFTVFASVLHVTAVAVERIYAVRFPRKYYIFTKFRTKFVTISLIWVISLILTPTFAVLPTNSAEGRLIRGNALAIITLSVFIIYLSVAYFLFQQHKSVIEEFSGDSNVQPDRLRRLTIMCLFIGISFVACIAPITFGYLYQPFYHELSNFMVTLNSIINPCIYFVKVYHDARNNKRTRADTCKDKELIPRRGYGYTLTTIVDENDCKERNKVGGSPTPRNLIVRGSPVLRNSPLAHDSLMAHESPMALESPMSNESSIFSWNQLCLVMVEHLYLLL